MRFTGSRLTGKKRSTSEENMITICFIFSDENTYTYVNNLCLVFLKVKNIQKRIINVKYNIIND